MLYDIVVYAARAPKRKQKKKTTAHAIKRVSLKTMRKKKNTPPFVRKRVTPRLKGDKRKTKTKKRTELGDNATATRQASASRGLLEYGVVLSYPTCAGVTLSSKQVAKKTQKKNTKRVKAKKQKSKNAKMQKCKTTKRKKNNNHNKRKTHLSAHSSKRRQITSRLAVGVGAAQNTAGTHLAPPGITASTACISRHILSHAVQQALPVLIISI